MSHGKQWALLARTSDGGYFNGLIVFRVKDVKRVHADRTFESAFAKTQVEWPPGHDPRIGLDSTADVIAGLASVSPLIAIEKGHERSALWIGELDELAKKWVWLSEVRPDASWHPRPLGYKLRSVTAVSIGSHYLTGLSHIAGSALPLEE